MAKNPTNRRRSPRMKATLVAQFLKEAGAYVDIELWLRIVQSCNGNEVITGVRLLLAKIEIYTDSSFFGGGFAVTCGWFVGFPWPSSWVDRIGKDSKFADIYICFLELLSCAFAVRLVVNFVPGMLIRLWCDNLSVVHMIRKTLPEVRNAQKLWRSCNGFWQHSAANYNASIFRPALTTSEMVSRAYMSQALTKMRSASIFRNGCTATNHDTLV